MKKWIFRIGIFFGLIFGLGVVLVFGAVFYLESDAGRQRVQDQLNRRISGQMHWSALRLSLIQGRLEVDQLRLQNPSAAPVITVDRVSATLSWRALLSGTILIETAEIRRPAVHLRMDSQGTLDLAAALAPPDKKALPPEKKEPGAAVPFNVEIRRFRITGGSFAFSSRVSGKTETAEVGHIHVSLADVNLAQKSGRLAVRLEDGAIDMAGIQTGWTDFKINARLEHGEIRPVSAEIESDVLTLALNGGGRELLNTPDIRMNLELATTLEAVRRTLRLSPELAGPVSLEIRAEGKVSHPEAEMVLSFGGGRIAGMAVQGFQLNGRLSDRVLTVSADGIRAAGGNGDFSAAVNLKNAFPEGFLSARRELDAVSYQVDLSVDRLDLKALPGDAVPVGGVLQSRVTADGRGVSLARLDARGSVALSVQQMTQDALAAPADVRLTADAEVSNQVLRVTAFALDAASATLGGEGVYGWKNGTVTARVSVAVPDIHQPAALFGGPLLSGGVDASIHVAGSIRRPEVEIEIQGESLGMNQRRIGDLFADLRLENGRVHVRPLRIEDQNARLVITGHADVLDPSTWGIVPDPALDLAVEGRNLRLEAFQSDLRGNVRFTGRLQGTPRHPEGRIDVTGEALDLFGQKIEHVVLATRIRKDRVHLEPLRIRISREETMTGTGWISLDGTQYKLSLDTEAIALKHIHWLSKAGIDQGTAAFAVSGEGALENPRAAGNIELTGISIRGKPLEAIRLQAAYADHVVQVDARSDFDLSGRFHVRDLDFSARVVFEEMDLGPYFEMANQGRFSGYLSGTVTGRGNARQPKKIEAVAELSRLDLFFEKNALIRSQRFRAALENGAITATEIRLGLLESGHIDVRGSAALDGHLDLSLDAAIPLKGLAPLVPGIGTVDGTAALTAAARGPAASPAISGDLRLAQVRLTPPGFSQEIQDGTAAVHFTPEAAVVETIAGRVGDGRFDIRGKVALDGTDPAAFDLRLDAARMPFSIPGTLDLTLGGALSLTGTPDRSALTGEIVLEEGIYYKDVELNLLPGGAPQKRDAPPAPAEPVHPLLRHMALDVSIRQKNPLVVDNNVALLSIVSNLQVKGNPARPRLLGSARVKEGTLAVLGREFEIARGVIDFVNPYRIEPTIDIESKVEVRKWTIRLGIAGTPDRLVFTKTSTPPESDEDIMMLLTVGKTRQEMIQEEGGTWISSKALAAQLASGIVGDKVKDVTGLDIFEARYLEKKDAAETEGVEVTVGKELSKRLTVKYTLENRGGETIQRALSEYRLIENVAASAFQENTGNFGAEMVYRLEFR